MPDFQAITDQIKKGLFEETWNKRAAEREALEASQAGRALDQSKFEEDKRATGVREGFAGSADTRAEAGLDIAQAGEGRAAESFEERVAPREKFEATVEDRDLRRGIMEQGLALRGEANKIASGRLAQQGTYQDALIAQSEATGERRDEEARQKMAMQRIAPQIKIIQDQAKNAGNNEEAFARAQRLISELVRQELGPDAADEMAAVNASTPPGSPDWVDQMLDVAGEAYSDPSEGTKFGGRL